MFLNPLRREKNFFVLEAPLIFDVEKMASSCFLFE